MPMFLIIGSILVLSVLFLRKKMSFWQDRIEEEERKMERDGIR